MKVGCRCGISMLLLLPLSKPAIQLDMRGLFTILGERQGAM